MDWFFLTNYTQGDLPAILASGYILHDASTYLESGGKYKYTVDWDNQLFIVETKAIPVIGEHSGASYMGPNALYIFTSPKNQYLQAIYPFDELKIGMFKKISQRLYKNDVKFYDMVQNNLHNTVQGTITICFGEKELILGPCYGSYPLSLGNYLVWQIKQLMDQFSIDEIITKFEECKIINNKGNDIITKTHIRKLVPFGIRGPANAEDQNWLDITHNTRNSLLNMLESGYMLKYQPSITGHLEKRYNYIVDWNKQVLRVSLHHNKPEVDELGPRSLHKDENYYEAIYGFGELELYLFKKNNAKRSSPKMKMIQSIIDAQAKDVMGLWGHIHKE